MKIRLLFIILTFISRSELIQAQVFLTLPDSANFCLTPLQDTLDIDHSSVTPYPDTMSLDLDTDGIMDIKINMYTTPIPTFPSRHHIDILNLGGNDIEMLTNDDWLNAFRNNDNIQIEPNGDWKSWNSWSLLYFSIFEGAHWAGVESTDSSYINDMYILFRKNIAGAWVYGWIYYSGASWPAHLYLHHMAIENGHCNPTAVDNGNKSLSELILYPNPADKMVCISSNNNSLKSFSWTLYDVRGIQQERGVIHSLEQCIYLSTTLSEGIYFLNLMSDHDIISKKLIIRR